MYGITYNGITYKEIAYHQKENLFNINGDDEILCSVIAKLIAKGHDLEGLSIVAKTPLDRVLQLSSGELLFDSERSQYCRRTPLLCAAHKGKLKLVLALIAAGANIHAKEETTLKTSLHLAASSGHKDVVAALLAKGADVDAQDNLKQTPLHLAVNYGDRHIVAALIKAGANVDAQDFCGRTPLELVVKALRTEKLPVLNALIEAGAHVDMKIIQPSCYISIHTHNYFKPLIEKALIKRRLYYSPIRQAWLSAVVRTPTPLIKTATTGHPTLPSD